MQNYGFTLVEERELTEVGGKARLWRHEQSGAQLLSILNSDENKCFGVNFYTPPTNSTGVAHILEHSVLCGSDKYPVREPFVELLKGSLQTFLNAFTFPDKTCYPVASANLQDFYNLISVYLDAVFHPLLTRNIFWQEGWHIEAESADQPWSFKGVVYNEMKGAYSSPDSVLAEKSQQAMFPDNLYNLDSGGNPEHIPDLTYEAFRDFHHRYYQPGNARFFFWGDDPEEERLRIISECIAGYGPVTDLPPLPLQKPFAAPAYIEIPYSASPGENRALFTCNWLLGERGDVELALKMEMLEHILEGMSGSPLRRALTESGLGEDMTGCGLETDLRQMYYSTGLKGIKPADAGVAEKLIETTLTELVDKGIDEQAVKAAVNTVEFSYRENNSGRFPRGLAAMIQALSTWLYGGNPIDALAWEMPLKKIKDQVSGGEKIFEEAIKKYLLQNPSRARVTLLPDPGLGKTRDAAEKARLDALQSESSPEQRQKLVEETKNLQKAQLTPDKPENLATIPALKLADIPQKISHLPIKIQQIPQTFISHDLPTHGIAYTSLLLPLEKVPARLLPYLPLFAQSLLDWGTKNEDYSQLGMRIAGNLGSFSASTLTGCKYKVREAFCYLTLNAKAVYDRLPELFSIYHDVLLEPQQDAEIKKRRLFQMLLEAKARLEYGLQTFGNMAVSSRIGAHYVGTAALNEKLGGISQLRSLQDLIARMEKDPAAALSDFEELRELIICSHDAIFDCIAEESALAQIQGHASTLLSSLPETARLNTGESVAEWQPMLDLPRAEAFITPGQVNYVGKGANLFNLGYKYNGSANVIMRWLRMGPLWEEVRVAGGAYGVFCTLDRLGGNFICASFRDPNVDKTLSVYDSLASRLRAFSAGREQLDQAIIGAIGDMDAYLLPDAKGAKALLRWLCGLNEEQRQQTRDEMLGTTDADFRAFADVIGAAAQTGAICVLGGAKTEQAAKEHQWQQSILL